MLVPVHLHLLQPVFDVIERLLLGDIIDQQSSDGTPVVGPGDRPEILLPSGVPDLQLNVFIFDLDGLRPELNPDGHIVREPSFILYELEDDTRLSDS